MKEKFGDMTLERYLHEFLYGFHSIDNIIYLSYVFVKVRQVPRSLAGYLNNLRRNLSAAAAVTSFVRKPASSNT